MEPMERAVVPPRELHFSATITFAPCSAAETAAAKPAPPPPITRTPVSISCESDKFSPVMTASFNKYLSPVKGEARII
jgi:hypothetical protein